MKELIGTELFYDLRINAVKDSKGNVIPRVGKSVIIRSNGVRNKFTLAHLKKCARKGENIFDIKKETAKTVTKNTKDSFYISPHMIIVCARVFRSNIYNKLISKWSDKDKEVFKGHCLQIEKLNLKKKYRIFKLLRL